MKFIYYFIKWTCLERSIKRGKLAAKAIVNAQNFMQKQSITAQK